MPDFILNTVIVTAIALVISLISFAAGAFWQRDRRKRHLDGMDSGELDAFLRWQDVHRG